MAETTKRSEYKAEIRRLTAAAKRTTSKYLKIDYSKRIRRMKKELAEYDYYQKKEKQK